MDDGLTRTRAFIADELGLLAPDGGTIPIRNVSVKTTRAEEGFRECRLFFTVDPQTWERVDRAELFRMARELRGPVFAGGFLPDVPIEIEARLLTLILRHVEKTCQDADDVAARLRTGSPGDEILSTESWYGMYVKQPRGAVKTGFATRWAPTAT